jgi:hypothetical protein
LAARYAFDVYPAADPLGDRLARLDIDGQLVGGWYRHVARGNGAGQISIHADHADATAAIFAPRNYVVFVRTDSDPEQPIGSFWLEAGEFAALSRREAGGRILTYGGPGALAVLERGMLLETPYAPSPPASAVRGGLSNPGEWFWFDQEYGSILLRGLEEGQNEPGFPLAFVAPTFDRQEDSAGNPWDTTQSWRTPIGTSVWELYAAFLPLGLIVQLSPGLMLGAWDDMADFATDRTSATFAAGKVRFAAGVNVGTELVTRIAPKLARSHVLVRASDTAYSEVDGGPGEPFWAYLEVDETDDTAAAERAGAFYLAQRDRMGRAYTVRHVIGDVDAAGLYAPGPDGAYWMGDLVTLHSGSLEHDADELPIEVAAITFAHDPAGNWYAEAELGAEYIDPGARSDPDAGGGAVIPPAGLVSCVPTLPGGDLEYRVDRLYLTGANFTPFTDDAGWEDATSPLLGYVLGPAPGTSSTVNGAGSFADVNKSQADWHVFQARYLLAADDLLAALQAGGATFLAQLRANARHGVGISEGAQDHVSQLSVRVISSGGTVRGTALALHNLGSSSGSSKWPASATYANKQFPPAAADGTLAAVPSAVAGDYLVVELGARHYNPTTGGTGVGIWRRALAGGADLPADDDSSTANLNSWIQIVSAIVGSETPGHIGAGHPDMMGEPGTATGCGHKHHVLRDAAPAVDDDEAAGYPEGTLWYVVDDLGTPTEWSEAWLSVDGSAGAAEWVAFAGGGAGGGSAVAARVTRAAALNVTSTPTAITWDTEERDDGAYWASGTPTRFTIPSDGWYMLGSHVQLNAGNGDQFYQYFLVNATDQRGLIRDIFTTNGWPKTIHTSELLYLDAGDYVEVFIACDTTQGVGVGADVAFWAYRVGD